MSTNPNDVLDQALSLLGYREELPSHHRSNLIHAIQQHAALVGNEGLEHACEDRLNLIRAENEAAHSSLQKA